jgi:hypothetical protein
MVAMAALCGTKIYTCLLVSTSSVVFSPVAFRRAEIYLVIVPLEWWISSNLNVL